ncbi:MAG: hypothetical protein HKN47_11715 [Pirellulaceae bacterium]|nr:hypothetical protein [Pirellulaceae bacterium]
MDDTVTIPPQRLQFSKGNWIAFGVLMLAAWMADFNQPTHDVPIEAFYSNGPVISRIVDSPVAFPNFGIQITPTDGWTYLQTSGRGATGSLHFVNESQMLLVSMQPVQFRTWPPDFIETETKSQQSDAVSLSTGSPQSKQPRRPEVIHRLAPVDYKHFVVEWFSTEHFLHGTYQYGRLNTGMQEFMIRVMSHRGTDPRACDDAISKLCNAIDLPSR